MSKLTLHITNWLNPDLTYEFIERTRPAVIKVFGDVGLDDMKIREARRLAPGTLFVGRRYFDSQGAQQSAETPVSELLKYNPDADAANVIGQLRPLFEKLTGLVDIWEGYNEIPIDRNAPLTDNDRQRARNLSAFNVALANQIHQAGFEYAAYSFSTGNPVHVELWDLLLEGLRASDFLALHEYIAPDANWQQFDTSQCNRYRAIVSRLPADARKPILITECGVDDGHNNGWIRRVAPDHYLAMLAAYDSKLMADAYVLGATIFEYGSSKGFESYNIGGDFTKQLTQFILATPTPPLVVPEPTTPRPPQPPAPEPVPGPAVNLAQALELTEKAISSLDAKETTPVRGILLKSLIPWFYASAPQHSSDLADAQAHTTARWFAEEAERKIEANDLAAARDLLANNVLPWLRSPGPHALGILAIETPKSGAPAKAKALKPPKVKKQSPRPRKTKKS